MQPVTGTSRHLPALVLLAGLVSGCQSYQKLSAGEYRIETPYGGSVSYEAAVEELDRRANRVCKQGYRKVHDFDTVHRNQRMLAWRIECAGITAKERLTNQVGAPVADGM